MRIDEATIAELLAFSDEIGVLSFYIGITPDRVPDEQPSSEIRSTLKELVAELCRNDKRIGNAVHDRVQAISSQIDDFGSLKAEGIGRAMFVGVQSGEIRSLHLQLPFPTAVTFASHASLRPLLEMRDSAGSGGIVEVSGHGVRVIDCSFGETSELFSREFAPAERSSTMRSKGGDSNREGSRGDSYKDRIDDHVEDNYHRFLRELAPEISVLASRLSWECVIVSGAPKHRSMAKDALAEAGLKVQIVPSDHPFENASPASIAEQVGPIMRELKCEQERQLVETAVQRALSGGAGAVGLRSVCAALNEGRVAHLFFDQSLDLTGFRSAEGTLHPEVGGLVAAAGVPMELDHQFVDHMVEAALASKAEATPLNEDVTVDLRAHEGVAALLRW